MSQDECKDESSRGVSDLPAVCSIRSEATGKEEEKIVLDGNITRSQLAEHINGLVSKNWKVHAGPFTVVVERGRMCISIRLRQGGGEVFLKEGELECSDQAMLDTLREASGYDGECGWQTVEAIVHQVLAMTRTIDEVGNV